MVLGAMAMASRLCRQRDKEQGERRVAHGRHRTVSAAIVLAGRDPRRLRESTPSIAQDNEVCAALFPDVQMTALDKVSRTGNEVQDW